MTRITKLTANGFKSFAKKTELSFGNGFNCVIGPNGSGKSCSYDTIVTLEDGSEVVLGELIESKLKDSKKIKILDDGVYCDSNEDIKIFSLNPKSMKIEVKKISKFIKREGDPFLYEIKTRSGKKVKTTGCHPVMIYNNGKIKSSLVKDLKPNNLIASPREITTKNKSNNKDLARIFGYLIGDGYITKNRIEFINKDPEVIEDLKTTIKKLFKIDPKNIRYEDNITRLFYTDRNFKDIILKHLKNKEEKYTPNHKYIPKFILNSDNETVANILSSLFDTDGHIGTRSIEFCTKNEKLANQIQMLLHRFNINSIKKERLCCATNTIKKTKRKYYYIYISGHENAKRFYTQIPLKCKYKKETLENKILKNKIPNPNSDLLPKETNNLIKKTTNLLGIKYKPIRHKYPKLAAYIENRCNPSRQGLSQISTLYNNKFNQILNEGITLQRDQLQLINTMDTLNISGREAGKDIGVCQHLIKDHWAKNNFQAKPENLDNFFNFIQENITSRLKELTLNLSKLNNLANSDIFWDKIVEIKKIKGEKYVYDLTIPDNHNFIGNGIFVHNSNIMDSLCFVLGKSSAKSMRAEKSANLIYNGGKKKNPSGSAEVAIFFDNSNKVFPLNSKEVKISRVIKKSGQSDYKINDKKMTRQQVIDLLSSAKIDPDGHNIILQGDITHFASMKPLERRLILEEIAGISVFEDKKNKAISELEKVEDRLTEANILLTEREAHLRELKKERDQAKKYLDLKNKIKDNKATYLHIQIKEKEEKKNKAEKFVKDIETKIEKINSRIRLVKDDIEDRKEEIYNINKTLEEKGEKEQIDLREGITNIKTDLTEAKTRTETIKKELSKIVERKKQLEENISKNNKKIESIFKEKNQIDTKIVKLEKQSSSLSRKSTPSADFTAKVNELANLRTDSNGTFTNPSLERISSMNGVHGTISELGRVNDKYAMALEVCAGARMKSVITKDDSCAEQCIKALKSEKLGIITFLPLNKIKPKDANPGTKSLTKLPGIHGLAKDLIKYNKKYENAFSNIFGSTLIVDDIPTARKIGIGRARMVTLEGDLVETSGAMVGGYRRGTKIGFKQGNTNDNKILKLEQEIEFLRKGTSGLEEDRRDIQAQLIELNSENGALESQINMLSDENERINKILRDHNKEKEDFESELKELELILRSESGNLKESEKKEKAFYEKVKDLTNKRNKLTEEIGKKENALEVENEKIRKIEKRENELSIYRAKHVAELEGLQKEFENYKDGKIRRNIKIEELRKEISEFEKLVTNLGNINMRALEIYEELVQEHQTLVEKTDKIKSEKLDVLDMIDEIEKKKTGIFMETYKNLNDKFKEIFNSLSTKGEASLVLENKEEPLEGGVDMVVKITNNKHMDIRSLSGGEKTLVTLAFIFSIQEHNPASFYILDEVDAALDKRNAEKLAKLFKKYSDNAQYVVISHNDSVITEADRLFGISMQEGISKITSLKL